VFSGCTVLKDVWDPREITAGFEKWLNFRFSPGLDSNTRLGGKIPKRIMILFRSQTNQYIIFLSFSPFIG